MSGTCTKMEEGCAGTVHGTVVGMTPAQATECHLILTTFDTFITSKFTVFMIRAFIVCLLVRVLLDIFIEFFMIKSAVSGAPSSDMMITFSKQHM